MKTNSKLTGSINRALVLSFIVGLEFLSLAVNAQFRSLYSGNGSASGLAISVEGGVSFRTFSIKSDVEAINKLKVVEEGWSAGLTVGGRVMRGRVSFANYKASTTVREDVSQRAFTTQINFYPLSVLNVKSKYFKPYFLVGLDISTIRFFGTKIPKDDMATSRRGGAGTDGCTCTCDGGPPADPDQPNGSSATTNGDPSGDPDLTTGNGAPALNGELPSDPDLLPEVRQKPWENKLTATQGMIALGFEVNYKKRGRTYYMFSEARYGFQLNTNTVYKAMVNTSISNQWSVVVGVGFGISKK